jgi:abortive infection bacteriophage resistance protein
MLVPYSKPSLSVPDQAQQLIDRGLVTTPAGCVAALTAVSYYRLSGYLWWYRSGHGDDFLAGTTLVDAMTLHDFDSSLRRILFSMIEIIEVRLRATFANVVGHALGPMGYALPANANSTTALARDLIKLSERLSPPTEDFIANFYSKHSDPYPPVWMATEVMTLGLISKWFDNLGADSLRKRIAAEFSFFPAVFGSYLRQLTIVRNVCAHHGRLWNRRFSTEIILVTKNPVDVAWAVSGTDGRFIYRALAMTVHIVHFIQPGCLLVAELKDLLIKHRDFADEMDVPKDFELDAIWK